MPQFTSSSLYDCQARRRFRTRPTAKNATVGQACTSFVIEVRDNKNRLPANTCYVGETSLAYGLLTSLVA